MVLYILLFSLAFYSTRILLCLIGSKRERNISKEINPDFKHFISVVIPSRNEENNIEKCILALSKSNYPKDKFEILVVNDRSTDNTSAVANNLTKTITNLRVLDVTEDNRNKNLKGKPGALDFGIKHSNGEIILMTDADCIVNENWIRSIANTYENNDIKIGAAFTTTHENSLFEKFQSIEWITICTLGSAGVALNRPIGCFGNNMSIRKETYLEIGGYENIKFSITEDLALLTAVMKKGYKARYICSYDTLIKTNPISNFEEYLKQHQRWAKGGLDLGLFAVYFVLASMSIWISTIALISIGSPWFFIPILFKSVTDFIQIYIPLKTLKEQKLMPWVIIGVLFNLMIELIVPFLLFKKKVVWKDQVFK